MSTFLFNDFILSRSETALNGIFNGDDSRSWRVLAVTFSLEVEIEVEIKVEVDI